MLSAIGRRRIHVCIGTGGRHLRLCADARLGVYVAMTPSGCHAMRLSGQQQGNQQK